MEMYRLGLVCLCGLLAGVMPAGGGELREGLLQAVYRSWQAGPATNVPDIVSYGAIPGRIDFHTGKYTVGEMSISGEYFYSVWTGFLVPPASGDYRFRVATERGAALLSVNGVDLLNDPSLVTEAVVRESDPIRLVAGQRVPISVFWRKGAGIWNGSFEFGWRRDGETAYSAVPLSVCRSSVSGTAPFRCGPDADGFGRWFDLDLGSSIPGVSIVEGEPGVGETDSDRFSVVFMSATDEKGYETGNTSDRAHFLLRKMTGDFLFETSLPRPTGYHNWRRQGLVLRDSLESGARALSVVRSWADGRLLAEERTTANGKLATFFSRNLNAASVRVGIRRIGDTLRLYLDGEPVASRRWTSWPEVFYLGFVGSSWGKEHEAISFFQNCRVKRMLPNHGFCFAVDAKDQETVNPEPLRVAMTDFKPVYKGLVTTNGANSVRLRLPSAEWNCGLVYESDYGVDLSSGRYLAVDVKNRSTSRQMRLSMSARANREIITGIGLNPGERRTMYLQLPHAHVYGYPASARGPALFESDVVTQIAFKVQWPYESEFRYVADCDLSNLRLVGRADLDRRVKSADYLPFIDAYGQFAHGTWPEKVTKDSQLVQDLKDERAALKSAPSTWDSYGGYAAGPTRTATGRFRVEKVDGKWWFVTPEGHLFYSFGINVIRTMTDAADGRSHPDWYASAVPKNGTMSFTSWSLAKKFATSNYTSAYYDFVLARLDSWGINTIGNWSAGDLTSLGRKPYVLTVFGKGDSSDVPMLSGVSMYDCLALDFQTKLVAAVKAKVAKDPALVAATTDPMCIGFFIDNELGFDAAIASVGSDRETAYYEAYFKACKAAVEAVSPGRLYLGCRFKGLRMGSRLWNAAAKYCDVVSVNSYVHSIFNTPTGLFASAEAERPLLHTEFHYGCADRGMFNGGLCAVGTQSERGMSLRRCVEGALVHPLVIGSHWFQYRDQPLTGRGDGENYEVGFVDVVDRPYPELTSAAREIGEKMYTIRTKGVLP